MNKQKRNSSSGITLIALVISIIVMLILVGVSLNAIVGENGVLTQAQNAVIANRKAEILEALNLELTSYNIDTITGNTEETQNMLNNLINKDLVEEFLDQDGTYKNTTTSVMGIPNFDASGNYTGYIDYSAKKDDYKILISVDDNGIYTAEYGDVTISAGGTVAAGTTLVTSNAFENGSTDPVEAGKFTIDNDASVMFVDEVGNNGEQLSIYVTSGTYAKVNIFKNMTLTNADIDRSAIEIEPGGKLDIWVKENVTLTVDSGTGKEGETTGEYGAKGGPGGYAGIRVPWKDLNNNKVRDEGEFAELTLKGKGTVIAYGGNAGEGGGAVGSNTGGGGGGGAGAGIGGNGGTGGHANDIYETARGPYLVGDNSPSGEDGKPGENAGSINICNSITIYAYGGGGGSGGALDASGKTGSGGGGGGYPAAGIGGGGAGGGGGEHAAAGGGYSGAAFESAGRENHNGLCSASTNHHFCAGGYYTYASSDVTKQGWFGLGGTWVDSNWNSMAGSGGIAGEGGVVKYSENAIINAYNGDRISNGDYTTVYNQYKKDGTIDDTAIASVLTKEPDHTIKFIPALIFIQNGIKRAVYNYPMHMSNEWISKFGVTRTTNHDKVLILAEELDVTSFGQGIGSGAGYIEVSNGTYTVDPSLN